MALAYSATAAAKVCGVSSGRIVQAARDGKLVIRKTGEGRSDHVVILATDLQAWLESLPLYDMKTPVPELNLVER